MASLLNGFSQMGKSIATFAGNAGMEQQKADLEKEQTVLADQLKSTSDIKLVGVRGAEDRNTAVATAKAQGDKAIEVAGYQNTLPMTDAEKAQNKAAMMSAGASVTEANKPITVAPGSEMVDRTGKPLFKSQGANLSDDALDRMADQALAGDKSVFTGLGYGNVGATNRAALAERITQKGKERGLGGSDLAALNAQFMGIQAGERSLGTRSANIGLASHEFLLMAPLGLQASEKVDRTQYPTLNAVEQSIEKGTGDENVVRLGAATNSLVNIYARAINPTGVPTDSDKAHARDILDKAYSKGQYAAAVDQLQQEIGAALKAPGAVRGELHDAVTGRTGVAIPTVSGQPADASSKVPSLPPGVPTGSQYSPSRKQWRAPDGTIYNDDGSEAK